MSTLLVSGNWTGESTSAGEISQLVMTEIPALAAAAAAALVGDPPRDPPRALRDLAASPALCSEHNMPSAGSGASTTGTTPDPARRGCCSCRSGPGSGALLVLVKNFWLGPRLMALYDGDEGGGCGAVLVLEKEWSEARFSKNWARLLTERRWFEGELCTVLFVSSAVA